MWLSGVLASPRARRGREGGALQRLAAPCSVQPGWDCCLSTAASCNLSVFFYEKQSNRQRSVWEGLFWMWSLESTVCYITAVVTQPCNYTQHGLGLLIKQPLVESSSSVHKKDTKSELVESGSTNKPQKKRMDWRQKHSLLSLFSETTAVIQRVKVAWPSFCLKGRLYF